MDKPYLLRPWEIERLTDKQIIELYYRKRDKNGTPLPIDDKQHEWLTRKKFVPEADLVLQKFNSFMKMGAMMGGNPYQMKEEWIKKYGKIPEQLNG